jgi:hypothetical protein
MPIPPFLFALLGVPVAPDPLKVPTVETVHAHETTSRAGQRVLCIHLEAKRRPTRKKGKTLTVGTVNQHSLN